jgi:hypothetical protein
MQCDDRAHALEEGAEQQGFSRCPAINHGNEDPPNMERRISVPHGGLEPGAR